MTVQAKKQSDKEFLGKLHDKYYGPGSKSAKKKAKNGKVDAMVKAKLSGKAVVTADSASTSSSRAQLMEQARKNGIKNFRILSKVELEEVNKSGTSQERIKEIVSAAVARWKSGWGTKSKKNSK